MSNHNHKKVTAKRPRQQSGEKKRKPVLPSVKGVMAQERREIAEIRKKQVIQVTESLLEGTFVIDNDKIAEAMLEKK